MVDDAEEEFHPNLHRASSLSVYLYQLLLIESEIVFRHGKNLRFSLRKLDDIKFHLQENLDVRYTRFFFKQEAKSDFFFVSASQDSLNQLNKQAGSIDCCKTISCNGPTLRYYTDYPISKHLNYSQS